MVTPTNLGPRVKAYYQIKPTRFAEFRMWRKAHNAWVVLYTDNDGTRQLSAILAHPRVRRRLHSTESAIT